MKEVQLHNGQKLIIRKATPDDASHIIAYIDQISRETDYLTFGPGEFGISVDQEIAFIESVQNSDNQLMICAFVDHAIVGQLTFMGGSRPRTRHTGELGVSVLKKDWRLGVGTELIKYSLNWAKETHIVRKVNLRVRSDNAGAIRLYESLGFVYEGKKTREFSVDGIFYDSIHMGIEIN
ncbi:MAG TPA: GNAT family protein [Limnochordia bacterium]|nr:GNAT family protein [Limnochordia bacterium]